MGPELTERFRAQSERFGTRIFTETVNEVDLSKRPFRYKTDEQEGEAKAIIIATGATAKRDDVPGTRDGELWQKGVSRVRGVRRRAADVPQQAAVRGRRRRLARWRRRASSRSSPRKVYIVHRRDELRASAIMQAARAGEPQDRVPAVAQGASRSRAATASSRCACRISRPAPSARPRRPGLFFAIGHVPNTAFLGGQIKTDDQGYILTMPGTTQTNVPGVFAAGDCQDKKYRQAITAAGTGCMAALEAEHFLAAPPLSVGISRRRTVPVCPVGRCHVTIAVSRESRAASPYRESGLTKVLAILLLLVAGALVFTVSSSGSSPQHYRQLRAATDRAAAR